MDVEEEINKFKEFFDLKYKNDIINNIRNDKQFIKVDFKELITFDPVLGEEILERPDESIESAETAIKSMEYFPIEDLKSFKVRFFNFPEKNKLLIRNIRSEQLQKLVVIEGIVRQKSDVRPQAKSARFECPQCGNIITVYQVGDKFREPSKCSCGRKGKFRKLSTEYVDSQRIVLEEIPEQLEGDAQPKRIDVFLEEDLVSPMSEKKTNPGSNVRVSGILKETPIYLRSGGKSLRFDLRIEANNIEPLSEDYSEIEILEEEEKKIKEIAKREDLFKVLVNAIAPSIFGYETLKLALLLQQVGGVEKIREDQSRTRGDIHVLLVGDPGAGKSQLLKRMSVVAPKAKFVSGKSASGAGLTASVVKDEFLRGWALEAGALVLANKGLCAIDELDKMNKDDRSAMHEALEQQTISISKANIQATLVAKTSVLGAANPKLGRFDPMTPIARQIDLPPTLINRFDLIFIVRDLPSKEKDEKLAEHILKLHQDSTSQKVEIDTDLLRKYIAYSKSKFKPVLSDEALNKIKDFYVELRNTGSNEDEAVKPIPISARQLEALVRLAEARAKLKLSNTVTGEDAQLAIDILTFCLQMVGIDPETKQMDIDLITTGISSSQRGKFSTIRQIIDELEKDSGKVIPIEEIVKMAEKFNISESQVEEIIEKLKRTGDIFEPRRGHVQKLW